mgnify:CR=1 FL=1
MKIERKYLSSKIGNVNFYFKHILLQTIYITITQYIVDRVIYNFFLKGSSHNFSQIRLSHPPKMFALANHAYDISLTTSVAKRKVEK